MVSLDQASLSPNQRKAIPESVENTYNLSQKRKWEGSYNDYGEQGFEKRHNKAESKNFMADIELHLETPLPSEWQRCLDIQSGKIHFYNTKTHTRTPRDPRRRSISPEKPSSPSCTDHHDDDHHMISLDLELNLTTSEASPLIRKTHFNVSEEDEENNHIFSKPTTTTTASTTSSTLPYNNNNNMKYSKKDHVMIKKSSSSSISSSTGLPSWLALEVANDQQAEMVPTVCMRCHMLVMLYRSSPSCPNCKFMHSSQNSTTPNSSSFIQVKL